MRRSLRAPEEVAPSPRSARAVLFGVLLTLALLASVALAISLGQISLSLPDILRVILTNLSGQAAAGDPSSGVLPLEQQIVWELRLPRVLLTALVGAALALAGAVLQGLVGNPLADPFVIGVSSGSSLGAVSVMAFGSGALLGLGVSAAAFAGALLTLLILLLLTQRSGTLSGYRIVLAGVALGQLAMAGTMLIQLQVDPGQIRGILFWMLGSTSGARWDQLPVLLGAVLLAAAFTMAKSRQLNALAFGEADAVALGVSVNSLRFQLLIATALLTAVAVAVAGAVGFVGLIVPHALRLMGIADYRRLLPLSLLSGATFLVLIDLLSRLIDPPNEYPLTIFTAVFGAPFFLWLLYAKESHGHQFARRSEKRVKRAGKRAEQAR